MIPKIIHFVWVGNASKPEVVQKCMASWKKYCPDYKIMEWGDESLAEINNEYANQALFHKKWAFVSDVIRLYALKKHGGIYVDTDLEIIANLDKFLHHGFFTGYEASTFPVTALMGAEKDNYIISDLLYEYKGTSFIKPDGTMDVLTNTKRISNYFAKKFGLVPPYDFNTRVDLTNRDTIYPYYFFCTPKYGQENYSIHHFDGSWVDAFVRKPILSLGWIKIAIMRRMRAGKTYPLMAGEKILMAIPIRLGGRKKIAFIFGGDKW